MYFVQAPTLTKYFFLFLLFSAGEYTVRKRWHRRNLRICVFFFSISLLFLLQNSSLPFSKEGNNTESSTSPSNLPVANPLARCNQSVNQSPIKAEVLCLRFCVDDFITLSNRNAAFFPSCFRSVYIRIDCRYQRKLRRTPFQQQTHREEHNAKFSSLSPGLGRNRQQEPRGFH